MIKGWKFSHAKKPQRFLACEKSLRISQHDKKWLWIIAILIVLLAAVIICAVHARQQGKECSTDVCSVNLTNPPPQMANPASVYCINHNGTLEIRNDQSGGQYGVCIFANGTECDEWKYFRGEC